MRIAERVIFLLLVFALLVVPVGTVRGQIRYDGGQNVAPVFEGWERNADGTFTMVFGYLNRNYKEEPHVPIGPANSFEPGPADRGQPTHFYARRQQFVFRVVVPADWGDKDLVWTVTHNGRTDKAYGSLWPIWEIDEGVVIQNRGGGTIDREYEANKPPSITLEGPAAVTVTVGEAATLSVDVTDDGLPPPRPPPQPRPQVQTLQPRPPAGGAPRVGPRTQAVVKPPAQRPGVTWVHYRGPGKVTFSEMSPALKEGKATITASFSEPGTYVLRAYADDGVWTTPADVTVTVNAASSSDAQR